MQPVIFPLKLQMKRPEVGNLHQALSVLGFTIAGPEKKNQRFGASTRAAVRQFQVAHKLRNTGTVDQKTARAINEALAEGDLLDEKPAPGGVPLQNPADEEPQPGDFYVVTGRVLQADGPSVMGVEVQALHKNLRSEVLLGKQHTNKRGSYLIRYVLPKGVTAVDLAVRVLTPDGDRELVRSDLICHARRIQVVDLVVGEGQYRGFSEFERLNRAVQTDLDGASIVALNVDDIELLACKTQQEAVRIAYLVVAHRYEQRTDVEAAVFYGLFRHGLPTSLPALLSQQSRVLGAALKTAVRGNVIPAALEPRIHEILRLLKQAAINVALDVPDGHVETSLSGLLGTIGLSAAQQSVLLTRYALHQGTIQEFWTTLKADPEFGQPTLVEGLQFTLQLGTLAGGYVPLVKELQDRRKIGQIKNIQDLATLQHEDWMVLVNDTGTPPGTPGETEAERVEYYAKTLEQTIEVAFSTPVIVAGLKRRNSPDQQDLLRFFDNSPDFTFETNIDRYLLEKSDAAVAGITDVAKMTQQLKQQQRVYNLAPQVERFTAMTSLLDAELDSAQAIVNMGQQLFVKSLSGPLGGDAIASEVFSKAVQTHAQALTTFGQYSVALNIGTPAVIRNLTAQGAGIPTWESLFGSLSFCECEDCRSVYSPAAYFVDLLQFVKQQPEIQIVGGTVTYPTVTLPDGTTRPKTALDVLFERRRDLGEIQLSCQNTNTLMPYIDLVNEVLESAVVLQAPVYQTTWTAEELSANAEHQTDGAYLVLAVQVYPRALPFNLWLHETRTYLTHLGASIVELIDIFYRPGQTGAQLAAVELLMAVESLGLSLASAQIITNTVPRPRSPWEFWGWHLEPPNWPDVLADLPTFLTRAQIEYATLDELRKARFINADGKLSVTFATPCNIEGATIQDLTEPVLDRIHRSLRLRETIGWELSELDAAIAAMQASDLTPAFLVQISQIQRLKTEINRPLLEMLSWWSTISTVVDESDPEDRAFYDELFLNNAVLNPVDDAFHLNATRSDLENAGSAPLSEHKPAILAALSITEADLALILTDIGKTEAEGLTLVLLSALHRHASLAKALNLSIADFLSLQKLTGIEPFKIPWTTLSMFEEVERVTQSKFNVATLDYLLRHVYTETSGLAPSESSIVSVLDGIKAGLETIAAENVVAADPTGELTSGRLALLLTGEDLQDAIAIIEGTSTLPLAEQEAFIDEHFGIFLGDTTAIKALLTQPIDPTQAAQQKQARYEHILDPLVSYLKTTLSTQLVIQTIADLLTLETAVAESMLTEYVMAPHDMTKKAIAIFLNLDPAAVVYTVEELDTYRLLHKMTTVLTTLKVTTEELVWIFEKGPALGWLDLNQLPLATISDTQVADLYKRWKRVVALYDFRDEYPAAGDVTVFTVFDQVGAGSDRETVLGTISSLTGWNSDDLDYLTGTGGFNLTFPEDYGDERYLVQLQEAFTLLARLGVSAATAYSWQAFENLEQLKTTAAAIKSAAKAKYDNATWLTVAEPLKNQLRERQRNALMAHLIARRPVIEEASDLFEQYLIDAEMNACMKTSRIKQAISSVQLFVQRSLMNLEPHVEISEISAQQWSWMKNYRVWEANRKIFLYPENWIVPELRDDKSLFFKELENELLQNEITQEAAESAIVHYLEKLDEVANLDVRAIYHQKEGGEAPVDILHVFARTHASPQVYYYRRYVDSAYWTPWEKLDSDIEGDHLLAVVWNRRLYLMWPVIEEEAGGAETCPQLSQLMETEFPKLLNNKHVDDWDELKTGWMDPFYEPGLVDALASEETDLAEQTEWLEDFFSSAFPDISFDDVGSVLQEWADCRETENRTSTVKLAWAEYQNGVWTAEKTSEGALTVQYRSKESFLLKPETEQALFQPTVVDTHLSKLLMVPQGAGDLVIRLYASDGLDKTSQGIFRFTTCHGRVVVTADEEQALSLTHLFPTTLSLANMQYVEGEVYDVPFVLPDSTVDSAGNWTRNLAIDYPTAFNRTPGQFLLTVPHQYNEYVSQDDLFYRDDTRCFRMSPQHQFSLYAVLQDADLVYFEATMGARSTSFDQATNDQIGLNRDASRRPAMRRASRAMSSQRAMAVPTNQGTLIQDLLDVSSGPLVDEASVGIGVQIGSSAVVESERVYRFSSFYHPHLCTFFEEFNGTGIDGLMQRTVQERSTTFFDATYDPEEDVVAEPYPVEDVDFSTAGAYSQYNWELFFHAPLLIATRMSQNQRFEEAQRWFHYIFNPTARVDSANVIGPERYWNFLPFYEGNVPQTIDELMLELNAGDAELEAQVAGWRENPFNPHVIARMRPVAYMKTVVMKYLDNLIAWGDSLFRQDTIESINEATQLYVLAANILGPCPQSLPADEIEDSETYNSLADKLDDFSNALVQIENEIPANRIAPLNPLGDGVAFPPVQIPRPISRPLPEVSTLYFCVPKNNELNAYWDTVADRLFKIRNCMNIEGVVRELPLFEPPINPMLLVQAAAAGIDISSVLSDLYAPLPCYRFQFTLQKAMEFCADVRSLGGELLSALEKQDAEALAILRASQELQLLESVKETREQQIDEAQETLESLQESRKIAETRLSYYQGLLDSGLNPQEQLNLLHLTMAHAFESSAGEYELRASRNYRIPDVSLSFKILPTPPFVIPEPGFGTSFGGSFLGNNARARATKQQNAAAIESFQANLASITGGYERRKQEWQHQADLAGKDLDQIDKQIAASQIRVAITEQELANHNKQIEHAQAVHDFMKNKYTNDQLYSWMVSQISSIYFQSYQMAYDLAKRAEKAYQHELSLTESAFISFGYWDSLKKGLLSGEKLQYDLRRMEKSYLEQNKREYELTKHVSLAMLDPVALLKLQTEGECYFSLPEVIFDFDFPGQYLRRIKSISVSIPCLTGPYTTVSANLTLLSNRIRRDTIATGEYSYTGLEDSRFQHNVGAIQSIAVSSGQQDSGLFELNFRDERYLPFEGSGVISDWKLKLTSAVPTFDWSTITDVVIHLRYTAREGGDLLRDAALKSLESELIGIPLQRSFSARHEFPTEWNAFLRPTTETEAALQLDLSEKRFPYFARGLEPTISKIELIVLVKSPSIWSDTNVTVEGGGRTADVTLASADNLYGGNPSGVVEYQGVSPGAWTVRVTTTSLGLPSDWIDDFVVIATYQVTVPV